MAGVASVFSRKGPALHIIIFVKINNYPVCSRVEDPPCFSTPALNFLLTPEIEDRKSCQKGAPKLMSSPEIKRPRVFDNSFKTTVNPFVPVCPRPLKMKRLYLTRLFPLFSRITRKAC